ncbi:MAG: hypothetical protein SF339_02530 [Blastocatellia bacterium]|nr:hypothetical protein [Blastocatellia bacterium]
MRKYFLLALSLSGLFIWILSVSAGGPVFWRVNTRAEIEKGDAVGVSIADNGTLTLAPTLAEVFDTKQAYIWSAVADSAGNVYLGTGHDGRVFKVDAGGKGSLLYKTSELDVMALAVDGQGNVYAGTAPDGKVYRITPAGEAKVFFDPKAKYIWSLAFDGQGRLLVGTGDKGIIYRVNADGAATPFVKTTQTNITAMRLDGAGNVIAGTDPGGFVLRISPEGKVFTLFDSSQREIRDLAIGRGGEIYALALSESAGSGATNASPAAVSSAPPAVMGADEGVTITISDVQILDATGASPGAAAPGAGSGAQSKAALYRLDGNGASDLLWDSREAAAFAIALEGEQRVLIGTGQKGRIYGASASQRPALIAQSSEAQTSRFVRVGNQLFAAASNLGKLFKLTAEPGASGVYTSSVRDAAAAASWGRLAWVGEGSIEFQTRSGNTANPDSTWSDWSAPIVNAEGDAIKSPPARFLQWRASMRRGPQAAPRLREVVVSYLPRNLAPRITTLNVLASGVALQALPQPPVDGGGDLQAMEPGAAGAGMPALPPRRFFQRGAASLQWQAEDRNGDQLEYAVFYRSAAGGDFFPLKTGLRETYFTVDANALPDGRYVFKVVASDALSNPAAMALKDDQETEPVEIDNTPPAAAAEAPRVSGNAVEILFRASDGTSIIRRGEYQLDGTGWKSLFPVDGIADSRREEFRVSLQLPDARPHVIAFRAFDANGNVGSVQTAIAGR